MSVWLVAGAGAGAGTIADDAVPCACSTVAVPCPGAGTIADDAVPCACSTVAVPCPGTIADDAVPCPGAVSVAVPCPDDDDDDDAGASAVPCAVPCAVSCGMMLMLMFDVLIPVSVWLGGGAGTIADDDCAVSSVPLLLFDILLILSSMGTARNTCDGILSFSLPVSVWLTSSLPVGTISVIMPPIRIEDT